MHTIEMVKALQAIGSSGPGAGSIRLSLPVTALFRFVIANDKRELVEIVYRVSDVSQSDREFTSVIDNVVERIVFVLIVTDVLVYVRLVKCRPLARDNGKA